MQEDCSIDAVQQKRSHTRQT